MSGFDIDRSRLDDEWVDQPRMYNRYALASAEARLEYNRAKATLDVTKAETELRVRKNPEKYELTKVTESVIASVVLLDKQCQMAAMSVAEARHDLDVAEAAVSAMDHRKKALEDLVRLFLADYFSKPREPEGAKDVVKEMERGKLRKARVLKR